VIPKTVFLLELLYHSLNNDPEQGLQIWSNMFDQALQSWDIKGCYQLLREIRRLDLNTAAGQIASMLSKTAQGTLAAQVRDWETAVQIYKKLLTVVSEESLGWIVSDLGNIYYLSGDFENALQCYAQALEAYERTEDAVGLVKVWNNLGTIYRDLGDIPQALQNFKKASSLIPEHDLETKSINLANWASVLQVAGRLDEAEEKYLQALACLQQIQAPHLLAQILGNVGTLYIAKNIPAKAIEYLSQDLAFHQQLGDLGGQGETLNNLGLAYGKNGNIKDALHCYVQSAQIKQGLLDVPGELGVWKNYLIAVRDHALPVSADILQRVKMLMDSSGDTQAPPWLENLKVE